MARQIYLSSLDLAIHGEEPPPDAAGLQRLVDQMRPEISLVHNPPGANMLRSFGHNLLSAFKKKEGTSRAAFFKLGLTTLRWVCIEKRICG